VAERAFTIFIGSSTEAKKYAQAIATVIEEYPLFSVVPWWHGDVNRGFISRITFCDHQTSQLRNICRDARRFTD
jgi:hypothetical protein